MRGRMPFFDCRRIKSGWFLFRSTFLLEQMKNRVAVSERMLDHADELNAYGVVVRYPNQIEIEEYQVVRAIRFAEEFFCWAKAVTNH